MGDKMKENWFSFVFVLTYLYLCMLKCARTGCTSAKSLLFAFGLHRPCTIIANRRHLEFMKRVLGFLFILWGYSLDLLSSLLTHVRVLGQANRQSRARVCLALLLLSRSLCVWSQGGLFFTSDKLSNTNITSICQDGAGYIWISTENGLNRFDGYKFTVYKNNPQDTTSLMFNIVNKVFCDKSGNLWVGTNTGLQRYDDTTDGFVTYNSPVFERARITDICELPDGRVLVGTAGFGLFQAEAASRTLTLLKDYEANDADKYFGHLMVEADGSLWKDGNKEFCLIKSGQRPLVFTERHDPPMAFCDADGKVLLMNRNHLSAYDNGVFLDDYYDVSEVASLNPHYWTVMRDRQGNIFIGTRGSGLLWIPKGGRKVQRYQFNVAGVNMNTSTIETMFEDRQGNIWVGCWHKGMLVIPGQKAQFTSWSFSGQKHDIGNYISSVCQGKDGITWCTVRDEGVFGFDGDGRLAAHPAAPAWTEFIYRDGKGNFYLGAGTEIYSYEPQNGKARKLLSFNCNMMNGMVDDGRGHLFFSAFGRGMLRYDTATGEIKHFSQNDQTARSRLCNDWIMSMTPDHDGHIWLATTNGVCCFDGAGFRHTILEGKRCESLCETSHGDMLIGTMEGLYVWRRSTGKVDVFPDSEQLSGFTICSIVEDRSGDIWCSTTMGIWHYRTSDKQWVSHVIGSGLIDREFVPNAGLYIPQDDRILFATSDGITTFTPEQVQGVSAEVGDVKLTNMFYGADNMVSMEFSLMNFIDAANTVFEYRLSDNVEWTRNGTGQNTITFAHLPFGTYELEVRAIVVGVVSPTSVYTFTIKAPWYRTTLAYILYIIGIIGLLAFMILKWRRRLHRQLDEDKRQFIATTTEEIRSPLNLIMPPLEKLKNGKIEELKSIEELQSFNSSILQPSLKVIDSNARRIDQYIRDIEVKGNDELLMERIMKCINDNISNSDLDVSLICTEAGISRSHLHRKMKEMTGLTVHDLIQNIRMEQAARLLTEQKINITQVAYAVGYSGQPAFSAAFRKHFGVSPTEYISQHQ